jgi:hypothetical protein
VRSGERGRRVHENCDWFAVLCRSDRAPDGDSRQGSEQEPGTRTFGTLDRHLGRGAATRASADRDPYREHESVRIRAAAGELQPQAFRANHQLERSDDPHGSFTRGKSEFRKETRMADASRPPQANPRRSGWQFWIDTAFLSAVRSMLFRESDQCHRQEDRSFSRTADPRHVISLTFSVPDKSPPHLLWRAGNRNSCIFRVNSGSPQLPLRSFRHSSPLEQLIKNRG